jgi:mevalonate kinase
MTSASAPGKVILLGEHAVVYGQPALAVPVLQVQARATVVTQSGPTKRGIRIIAPAVDLESELDDLDNQHPLAVAVRMTMRACGVNRPPALDLRIESDIPVAAGLGSGAAVSVAVVRALSQHLDCHLSQAQQSSIAFEVEKLHHGTPSGIDNTVVTFARPVFFVKGQPPTPFDIGRGFDLIVADSGRPSSTAEAVARVRNAYDADRQSVGLTFETIGDLVAEARQAIAAGDIGRLGSLMDENQTQLEKLGVSTPELDTLIAAARSAGASGAKLSGGGLGGNVIALLSGQDEERVMDALRTAGAARLISTRVEESQ